MKREIVKQTNWKGLSLKCRLSGPKMCELFEEEKSNETLKCDVEKSYQISQFFQFCQEILFSKRNFKGEKIKSPFHWLQLLMFNSNSICEKAMIRNNNFPYFRFPTPKPLFYANGLQIVVVIWLTICCFFFLISILFCCCLVRARKRKNNFRFNFMFVPILTKRKLLFCILVFSCIVKLFMWCEVLNVLEITFHSFCVPKSTSLV